jgi:hypothetical protein
MFRFPVRIERAVSDSVSGFAAAVCSTDVGTCRLNALLPWRPSLVGSGVAGNRGSSAGWVFFGALWIGKATRGSP